uniref:Acetylcholinesterase (inferred by orthology to a zebrafish protein) n=1 Tax=Strongyloides venezuelensis TaxID=75913 RepID=A0A0K0FTV2_STRVS
MYTKYGCVIKYSSKIDKDVTKYLGVPYAQPPLGAYRFKLLIPLGDKYYGNNCFDAKQLAKSCLFKRKPVGFAGIDVWIPKESDMKKKWLQLNIWVPRKTTSAVILFIQGTLYTKGSASLPQYRRDVLASKSNAIVVSFNYRPGALGFIQLLNKTFRPGNVGLLNQQITLKWIYENIGYFGGKKFRVVLFGHDSRTTAVTAIYFCTGQ